LELFLFGRRCTCTYYTLLVGVESQEIPVFDTAHHVDGVEVVMGAGVEDFLIKEGVCLERYIMERDILYKVMITYALILSADVSPC
jgi:hypothetical protein